MNDSVFSATKLSSFKKHLKTYLYHCIHLS